VDEFKELEFWDEHEIQLEDLSVPDKGSGLFFYVLGNKLTAIAATYFRVRLVALLGTIGLLFILFLPSSALLKAPVHAPYATYTTSQQTIGCQEITVNSKDSNWHIPPTIPTPPDSVTLHICSSGSFHFTEISPGASPGASNGKTIKQK